MSRMEFQEFVKLKKRMCSSSQTFDSCPMSAIAKECGECDHRCLALPEKAESIVAKWAEENPEKPVEPERPRVWTMEDFKAGRIAVKSDSPKETIDFLLFCTRNGINDVTPIIYKIGCDPALIRSHFSKSYQVIPFSALTLPEPPQEPQYREVKRRAVIGDRVRIVNPSGGPRCDYKVCDEFVIVRRFSAFAMDLPHYRDDIDCYLVDHEYVVLEPITEA